MGNEEKFKKFLGYTILIVALVGITVTLSNVIIKANTFEDWLNLTKALLSWQTAMAALVGFVAPKASQALQVWIAKQA